jgi:hypothetical protein
MTENRNESGWADRPTQINIQTGISTDHIQRRDRQTNRDGLVFGWTDEWTDKQIYKKKVKVF